MKMVLVLLLSLVQVSASKRVLDIYAKSDHEQTFVGQLRLLNSDPKGLKERDLIIRQHIVKSGFKIILTGKDGGVKYNSAKILPLAKLYAIIDAMPMRRDEMSKH